MFSIGERVICIDDSIDHIDKIIELSIDMPNWIIKGNFYTIRDVIVNNGEIAPSVLLNEVYNKPLFFKKINRNQEPSFASWRFSKLNIIEEVQLEELKAVI